MVGEPEPAARNANLEPQLSCPMCATRVSEFWAMCPPLSETSTELITPPKRDAAVQGLHNCLPKFPQLSHRIWG